MHNTASATSADLQFAPAALAAAAGAAGIFGMNMKSTLEMSVAGFWGVTMSIVIGCFYIFVAIMKYTQKKRIL
jgi:magnesium transporter